MATTVTRYGTRYGRTIRERVHKAELGYKGKHKCIYCAYTAVKRKASGIWHCSKCNAEFTSRAYQLRVAPDVKRELEVTDV